MTYVDDSMHQMDGLYKPQRDFMADLFGALFVFSGRATMRNLSRYGAGSERRLARWCRRPFDFTDFNLLMLSAAGVTRQRLCAVIDATFLPKSGKHTWGLGTFYNGCNSRPERGLEASVVGLVDLDDHTAYAVAAEQTPAELPEDQTRNDFYLAMFLRVADQLREHTEVVLADGAFANTTFIEGVTEAGFQLVSKLRNDANLRYLYEGGPTGKPGRPRMYAGKVDFEDLSPMNEVDSGREGVRAFTRVVNHPHFKRNLRVVVLVKGEGDDRRHAVLMSTDTKMEAVELISLYAARFQIEFVFRDGKQFAGLGHAQVRDQAGQAFFINASLSTVNVMRLEEHGGVGVGATVTSLMSFKRRKYNEMLTEKIFEKSGRDLNSFKSTEAYQEVCNLGVLAA